MPVTPTPPGIDIIDADELARRLRVPRTWVREHTRVRATDPIPHIKLGRYVRFEWGSSELNAWIANRRRGTVGKVLQMRATGETGSGSGTNSTVGAEQADERDDNDGDAA